MSAAPDLVPAVDGYRMPSVAGPDLAPSTASSLDLPRRPRCRRTGRPPRRRANPLLTDKLLDAKVRLHRRLIEEINLSALEKLPDEEMRGHVQQLVSQYVLTERLALNTQELNDFVSEILDEMTGLGPLEPLLKDPTVNDILINGHECVYVERQRHAGAEPACASRTRRICCASSTRSSPRSAAASMNRIRCATRGCSTARASTSRCGRSRSTGR